MRNLLPQTGLQLGYSSTVNQHCERAQLLLRQGDWAGYGEETRKLGDILKRLGAVQPTVPGNK